MVKIRFSSALHSVTRTSEKEIQVKNATVREIFEQLSREYGEEFEKRIFKGEEIQRFINVFLNGEDIRYLGGLDAKTKDGDELSVLPAVSGG